MNERALEGFTKIVELGSFTKAANALFLSQSALSQQIRTLENQLRFSLFKHNSRQVVLTAAGRNFYPKAKQILKLYRTARQDGQAIERNTQPPSRHLQLASQNIAVNTFYYDLFALTPELCMRYSPLVHRRPNLTDVWRAILTGEADMTFQHESAAITALGLRFTPILSLPEICIPFNTPDSLPQHTLTLEEAFTCQWIFSMPMDETLYEAELKIQAEKCSGVIIPRDGITSSQYGLPTLMLLPFLYHRRANFDFVRMLRWGEGSRFGVVTAAEPDEMVEQYIAQVQQVIRAKQHQLFGILS